MMEIYELKIGEILKLKSPCPVDDHSRWLLNPNGKYVFVKLLDVITVPNSTRLKFVLNFSDSPKEFNYPEETGDYTFEFITNHYEFFKDELIFEGSVSRLTTIE